MILAHWVRVLKNHPRRGNLALNGCDNVTATNAAVGASPGTLRMSDGRHDDMNRVLDDGAIEVPSTTLDTAVPAATRTAGG